MFICRWQNGDFSAVNARSKEEAVILLDQVGNAEASDLFTVKDFMVHFRLKKKVDDLDEMVPVEFEEFGEETHDILCERVYPIYSKAALECTEDWPGESAEPTQEQRDAAEKHMTDALVTERNRRWGQKRSVMSADPDAARLQGAGPDIPKAVAENIVRESRSRQDEEIAEMLPKSDKIQ